MGFRKHRRRGGGAGGGSQFTLGTGEPNGLQPGDDIGNRRSFKPVQLPPEDIGNRRDPEEVESVPEENIGNRIDASPTHEISGVIAELDGRKRRGRRLKGMSAPERVGRYLVGGVNPLIANNVPRPFPGKTLEESLQGANGTGEHAEEGPTPSQEGAPVEGEEAWSEEEGRRGRRGRRGRGRDSVDGVAAQEVNERRASRFFDFEEDDRFEYTLKSDPEQKRKDAEECVRSIVQEAGRDAVVVASLLEDGTRPKILVTIDEAGPLPSLPPERLAQNAAEPLFVMGNAALMSLNYLVNKIVNRYPDDRIRLAVLPASEQKLYMEALAEHRRTHPDGGQAKAPVEAQCPAEPSVVRDGREAGFREAASPEAAAPPETSREEVVLGFNVEPAPLDVESAPSAAARDEKQEEQHEQHARGRRGRRSHDEGTDHRSKRRGRVPRSNSADEASEEGGEGVGGEPARVAARRSRDDAGRPDGDSPKRPSRKPRSNPKVEVVRIKPGT